MASSYALAPGVLSAQPTNQQQGRAALLKEAAEAESLSRRLWDAAGTFDREAWLGTMYNEIGLPQARCYALGRMVGQSTKVRHLRPNFVEPLRPSTAEEARELRLRGNSLVNFVAATREIVEDSYEELALQWNLDCLGRQKIRGQPIDTSGFDTFYRIRANGRLLQVLGNIQPGFSRKLREAIERNPTVTTVALGSEGGLISEAIEAGRYIRARGLETTLWNYCYSACPLVFAGGTKRLIWSPYPSLGFHQAYDHAGPSPPDSPVYRRINAYLREMGVEPSFVAQQMWAAPPHEMNIIEDRLERICRARLATWVQRICSVDEKF